MGTTLTALNERSGVRLLYTAVIEGFPYVLTNDDPEVAILAYSECDTAAYSDDFTVAIGGMTIDWDTNQRITPWKPFPEPMLVRLSIVPAPSTADTSRVSDIVGQTIFRRVPTTYSELRANLDCNDTSVTVARADDFAASGTAYAGGLEAFSYSSRDTGTDVFTVSQRGLYPAALTSSGARWARTVKPLTPTEQDLGVSPVVTSEPTSWVGRWAAIWVHRVVGGIPDTVESGQSAAHCMFVGTIANVSDQGGATVIGLVDARQKIYGTRLLRDQFRAKLAEGVVLATGQTFTVSTERNSNTADTVGTGDPLTVVASGASGTNEIDAGRYSVAELGEKITAWLQGERAASRILFNLAYQALWTSGDGSTKGRLSMSDPTTGSGPSRSIQIDFPTTQVSRFMGWDGGSIVASDVGVASFSVESPTVPLRYVFGGGPFGALQSLTLEEPRGTWESQATRLPPALRDTTNGIDGVLKIGDLGYVRAKRTTDTSFTYTEVGMGAFFPGQTDNAFDEEIKLNVDESGLIDVTQVLVIESTFKTLLLETLLTTGTGTFNHATYDSGTEGMGCGIPFTVLTSDFITEIDSISGASDSLSCIIREPTSFHQLFEADFILRRAFLVWAGGRLRIKTWATPTSGYAGISLDETSKAVPMGTAGPDRAAASEQADYYNIVTIRFNVDAEGEYRDSLTIKDVASIRAHGERRLEVKARNTFRQVGAVGSPIDNLVSEFAGFFPFTSKPWTMIRRTIDQNYFEQAYPGVVLSLTAKDIRDPATGLRYDNRTASGGLSGYPGFVVGQRFDLGGPEAGGPRQQGGEVDIMISPQRTQASYVPCAEVDETAANAGYNAGTKTLTCKAHAHSESSEVADATRFVATDVVRVIEIDPVTAASPQTWTDTVASQTGNTITLTTGLAGYDTSGATLYRVIYAGYASCTSTQKTKCFQADDADGMIVDTVQAYGFGHFGSSQSTTVTLSAATEIPSRYATNAYGDGVPLDVGYEQDAVRLANNLIHYKTAPQQPTIYSETRDFTGAGTWQLVEVMPFFVGMGEFTAGRTRLLSVAPRIRSTSGATAEIRVTASRLFPSGTSRDDITRVSPYTSATFTTTSTTASVSTAQTLDISHVRLSDTLLGGVMWLLVEIKTATEFHGFARLKLGAIA